MSMKQMCEERRELIAYAFGDKSVEAEVRAHYLAGGKANDWVDGEPSLAEPLRQIMLRARAAGVKPPGYLWWTQARDPNHPNYEWLNKKR